MIKRSRILGLVHTVSVTGSALCKRYPSLRVFGYAAASTLALPFATISGLGLSGVFGITGSALIAEVRKIIYGKIAIVAVAVLVLLVFMVFALLIASIISFWFSMGGLKRV